VVGISGAPADGAEDVVVEERPEEVDAEIRWAKPCPTPGSEIPAANAARRKGHRPWASPPRACASGRVRAEIRARPRSSKSAGND
jgi:hypothetical protein